MEPMSFNEIPYDWLDPGTLVEVRPNYRRMGLVPFPARAVLIVQKLAAGTAIAKTLYRITRDAEGTALFGAGSIGESMVSFFKKANRTNDVYAIAMDDLAGGVKATGKFAFTGAGSGIVPLYIEGKRVRVTVTAVMTAAQAAAAAVAAINADTSLPVTAAQGGVGSESECVVTAKHKGETGNAIDLRVAHRIDEAVPAGLQVAVTAMAAGAGNPVLQEVLDAIANEWFTDFACPWTDAANLAALQADLGNRYKAMGKKDAHAYVGARGTFGQLGTLGGLTNSPHISPIGANKSPSSPWAWAASLAGVATFHLTNDPARQLRSLVLPGIEAPASKDRFLGDDDGGNEHDLLLRAGISTWDALPDGSVVLSRVVTTYKVSTLNVPDRAWLDIMVPKTATRIRWDWRSYVSLLYPRHKLADDDSPAADHSDSVVTPRRMHGTWGARCKLYERQAWIEDATRTVSESRFVRSGNDRNRMESSQQIQIIGNLMVLAAALEFQV